MDNDIQTSPLLKHHVFTDPYPVVQSSKNSDSSATIKITVKANAGILCKFITIEVPIGEDESDMFSKRPVASSSDTNWDPTGDNVFGSGNSGARKSVFNFKHQLPNDPITADVVFTISGIVNKSTGVTTIVIREYSSAQVEKKFTAKSIEKEIIKTPEVFYLRNLYMRYPTSENIVTFADRGKAIQLAWESNGDTFKLHTSLSTTPVDTKGQKFYKIDKGLTTDTSFTVEAIKDGKKLYQQYIAKVSLPDATFNTLTVDFKFNLPQIFLSSLRRVNVGILRPFRSIGDGFLEVHLAVNTPKGEYVVEISTGDKIYLARCKSKESNISFFPIYHNTLTKITAHQIVMGKLDITCHWIGSNSGGIQQQ